ncbi:MAG: ROK family protein [Bacteroides sp.]|nr:ROK family protein [Bacteroides sp.]
MKNYVIACDLGGTNTVFGVVDKEGNVLHQTSFKTQTYPNLSDFVSRCGEAIRFLLEKIGGTETVKAIGIGAPDVNYWDRTIENATNLPWKGVVPLAELLEQEISLPVRITNDAKAAALGEMLYGAARGMNDFIMLTLGTGVGSGIVVNGKLVYGRKSFAGELGHVSIRPESGRPCPCGRKGCLETYCSATGVAQTARDLLASYTDSPLHEMNPADITSKDVYDAAMQGDALSCEVFRLTGEWLGEACADFATFSDPEAFIFFGGLTKAANCFMPHLIETYQKTVFDNYKGTAKFLISQLEDGNAALLGAAALAWLDEIE